MTARVQYSIITQKCTTEILNKIEDKKYHPHRGGKENKTMKKELNFETQARKAYVSVCLEIYTYERSDIVTASFDDSQMGNDVTQDDIFN